MKRNQLELAQPPANRQGLSLVEVLIVIGVMGLLLSLLIPAVQAARAAMDRLRCRTNLKQIGLALQQFHSEHGRLPPVRGMFQPLQPQYSIRWEVVVLPYLGQAGLYDNAKAAYRSNFNSMTNPPHTGIDQIIGVYRCPADERLNRPQQDADGVWAGYTSYLGVGAARRHRGMLPFLNATQLGITFHQVVDGLSNTIMVGERPPPDSFQAGKWYPNHTHFSPTYGLAAGPDSAIWLTDLAFMGDPSSGNTRFRFGSTRNQAHRWHFWSLHFGGAHFLFGDGSTRFIRYTNDYFLESLGSIDGQEINTTLD